MKNFKVLGVVLELNPIHEGHKYFIQKAKEKVQPDFTIAVLSSSFSMRGEPIVMDKFTRAKCSLQLGVDLVLELPFTKAVQSADYFTKEAIRILIHMGMTHFAFGAECENISILNHFKEITQSIEFQNITKNYLQQGLSYHTSTFKAMKELLNDDELALSYTLPNNTLGLGYLKAIDELKMNEITIEIIQRIDHSYFDTSIEENCINSASALRCAFNKGHDISRFLPFPDEIYFQEEKMQNNLFFLLQYLFITEDLDTLSSYHGVTEGIEKRLESFIHKTTYLEFIENVQTKRYTKNRIQRLILHLLLKIKKDVSNNLYLRVLAMNLQGEAYLHSLPKDTKKMIITTFKNVSRDSHLNEIMMMELKATKLWGLLTNQPTLYKKEFEVPYKERNL